MWERGVLDTTQMGPAHSLVAAFERSDLVADDP